MLRQLVRNVSLVAIGLVSVTVPEVEAQKPAEARRALIARSQVWIHTDIPSMDMRTGPSGPGSFEPGATVNCEYTDKKLSGRTPKFVCRLPDGDELKVKYGGANGEVYGEVAATRLLWALGFGADGMYSVRVVCRGCPPKIGEVTRDNGDRLLDPAAVERKLAGDELTDQWSWDELDQVDEAAGGAPRAHRDALKLLAVMLQHSDSKPQQQRLICLEGEDTRCATPLMLINDVGITFGRANMFNLHRPGSVNLAAWSKLPIWKDPTGCVGNLSGSFTGTLKNPVISEAGRKFLADLLVQLADQQLHDMFEAARVKLRPRDPDDGRSGFATVEEWVAAFKQKRTEIVERRCAA